MASTSERLANFFKGRHRTSLDEVLTATNGTNLLVSTAPRKVNKIIGEMNGTLIKRQERAGQIIPDPVIEVVGGKKPGKVKVKIQYKGQEYSYSGKRGQAKIEGFIKFVKEYFPKAPECVTCDRIIFPGDDVGECTKGLMHMYANCCPAGAMFAGHIDENGQLVKTGPTLEELKSGTFVQIFSK